MLQRLFRRRPAVEAGRVLFLALAAQARNPAFYTRVGVADTVEGRFELYALHLSLVLRRLKGEGAEAAEVSQATFDAFLKNLDEGLREMGVGDLSVGKKMRRLGEALYGRMKGYDRVLAEPAAATDMAGMLERTVLEGRQAEGAARALSTYVLAAARTLSGLPLDAVLRAELSWPEVEGG